MRHVSVIRALALALLAACDAADDAVEQDGGQSTHVEPVVEAGSPGPLDSGAPAAMDASAVRDAAQPVSTRNDAAAPMNVRDAATSDAGRAPDAATMPAAMDAAIPSGDSCSRGKDAPTTLALRGDLGVHDPVIIASEGQYYLFATGRGVQTKRSSDLLNWQRTTQVFAQNPAWIAQQVPGATDLWAPDISFFGGSFHLYYSVSTFGSNRSCIGHATRASLSSGSWQDRGSVICSNANGARDDWNAIDPNVAIDEAGTPWLAFGSFWSGIKLIKLTMEGARADDTLTAIAGRNGGAIEAPFIVRHCGEYFLFVSFDTCCKGADSTYRIMVGRSRAIGGPYLDRAGMPLTRGGGTQIVAGDMRWRGPGHSAVLSGENGDYNIYHAYSATDGHSELRISELSWDDAGWPRSAGP